ncbi:response regulator [Clostridium sp. E02]|uniref:response regulator transcription factor n=1 Tax=Clostridium sp. E02 TaxID=2487134 RepID=UPI000F52DD16|nr:response regulator [Clostridium sp. E02]
MYRVLIADDELIERKVLYQTLRKELGEQCQIWQAGNGREALALFLENDIQIAIMDIEMPGINGIEAAEEMHRRNPQCSIIFLTAYDEFSYAKKAIGIRALDYLLKPCKEEELFCVVEEAMRLCDREKEGKKELPPIPALKSMEETASDGQIRLHKVAEVIQNYIEENYIRDLSMQDVARVMNYSEAYFCKLFKQCFDKNFTTYLTECRVEAAKKMLEMPTVNVKEIGASVGYSDSNYFTKVFKRVTGVNPTEYRMSLFQKK